MSDLRLFDVTDYGGAEPTKAEQPRKRERPDVVVEPLEPGYRYLRNRNGVLPYAHLIASTNKAGASVTLCGQIGTLLSNWGVTQMVRCQACDLAQQLDHSA